MTTSSEPLRIHPLLFLGRLIALLVLTFFAWKAVAPFYTRVLLQAARACVTVTELSSDPLWHRGTTLFMADYQGEPVIFYAHRNFSAFRPPIPPQGIPADWVMANVVLLLPLVLATPAPSWRTKALRIAIALALALLLQAWGIVATIKAFYANAFGFYWSPAARKLYNFLNVFVQSFDTQLFPVAIWAGIHGRWLRDLVVVAARGESASTAVVRGSPLSRAERRRKERGKRRK